MTAEISRVLSEAKKEVSDFAMEPLGITETSSSESIARLLQQHKEAVQNASKKCFPLRDMDEFSAKLRRKTFKLSSEMSFSSSSCVTFVPHKIYTIDEQTEESQTSVRKSERLSPSAEELRERIERLKRISAGARNAKRPVSRRGNASRPPGTKVTARINYHEEIVQKFDLLDRFLKDQMEVKQDPIVSSESSTRGRYSRATSTPEKNRVIKSLCCSCISGQ